MSLGRLRGTTPSSTPRSASQSPAFRKTGSMAYWIEQRTIIDDALSTTTMPLAFKNVRHPSLYICQNFISPPARLTRNFLPLPLVSSLSSQISATLLSLLCFFTPRPPSFHLSFVLGWFSDPGSVVLADLNTQSPRIRKLHQDWISKLVSTYQIDGIRIDAAKHVEMDFWKGYTSAAGVYCVGEVLDGSEFGAETAAAVVVLCFSGWARSRGLRWVSDLPPSLFVATRPVFNSSVPNDNGWDPQLPDVVSSIVSHPSKLPLSPSRSES
jgi:hypothetical protein